MQLWNTGRAALYGAGIGVFAAAVKLFSPWAAPHSMVAIVGEFAGAVLGFALLCAGAAVLRNFLARRLIGPEMR